MNTERETCLRRADECRRMAELFREPERDECLRLAQAWERFADGADLDAVQPIVQGRPNLNA
jgi:hypothetical protein